MLLYSRSVLWKKTGGDRQFFFGCRQFNLHREEQNKQSTCICTRDNLIETLLVEYSIVK